LSADVCRGILARWGAVPGERKLSVRRPHAGVVGADRLGAQQLLLHRLIQREPIRSVRWSINPVSGDENPSVERSNPRPLVSPGSLVVGWRLAVAAPSSPRSQPTLYGVPQRREYRDRHIPGNVLHIVIGFASHPVSRRPQALHAPLPKGHKAMHAVTAAAAARPRRFGSPAESPPGSR
jgi:hypothetical protein